jgi:hypothetical protein
MARKAKARDSYPKGFRRQTRITIRDRLIPLFKGAEPSPFAAEGPARAGVRSALCLAGWRWPLADAEAELLTLSALQMVGAKRPSWAEGQPEYVQPGVLPILRDTCRRCGKPLPEENRTFCGPVCAKASQLEERRRRYEHELDIAAAAASAAGAKAGRRRKAPLPKRNCVQCGEAFFPVKAGEKYCGRACYHQSRRSSGRPVRMVCHAL